MFRSTRSILVCLSRSLVMAMSASGEETPPVFISLLDKPKLPQLVSLSTGSGGRLQIIQKVCTYYKQLGTLLLDDEDGSKTKIAELSHPCDPRGITYDIMSDWLQRGGRKPITWATFITVLKEIGLEPLAKDIERLAGLHRERPLHSSMDSAPREIQSNPEAPVQANVKPPGRRYSREDQGDVEDDGSDPFGSVQDSGGVSLTEVMEEVTETQGLLKDQYLMSRFMKLKTDGEIIDAVSKEGDETRHIIKEEGKKIRDAMRETQDAVSKEGGKTRKKIEEDGKKNRDAVRETQDLFVKFGECVSKQTDKNDDNSSYHS